LKRFVTNLTARGIRIGKERLKHISRRRRSPCPGPVLSPLSVTVPLGSFCALLLALATKHFVADFLLQTHWMALGKESRHGWGAPLAVHVLCHACLTLCIALVVAPRLWWLALVDLAIHASVDRAKGLIGSQCGWNPTKFQYWWLLGLDQFLHQITNIGLAAAFVTL
jgi:hypothetical protein